MPLSKSIPCVGILYFRFSKEIQPTILDITCHFLPSAPAKILKYLIDTNRPYSTSKYCLKSNQFFSVLLISDFKVHIDICIVPERHYRCHITRISSGRYQHTPTHTHTHSLTLTHTHTQLISQPTYIRNLENQ